MFQLMDNQCSNKKLKELTAKLMLTIMMISEIQISAKLKKTWDLALDNTICKTDINHNKDFLFLNSDILMDILNTNFCHKKDLQSEMIQLVVQPVVMSSIMNGTLMLGMIFTVEENSNMNLIAFHYSNMVNRLFTTFLKCQSHRRLRRLKVLVKLEMIHSVVQLVAMSSIMNGILMLGMIFTVEENSNMNLIDFLYTNMVQRLLKTKLKSQNHQRW